MKALGVDDKQLQPRAALSRISQAKNRMETPADVRASGWSPREEQLAKIYESYLRTLSDASALDFDDLLLKTVELFETSEQVRERYGRKFKYAMVDEYQDTNRPQYLLIQRLARTTATSGRRRPGPVHLQVARRRLAQHPRFERDSRTRSSSLEQNYRSTQVILDAASAVISQNQGARTRNCGPIARGAQRSSTSAPATRSRRRFHHRTIRQTKPADGLTAVLYRTNAQSARLKTLMRGRALRSSAACAFTSARRSRTSWPTCASSSTRTTMSVFAAW